MDELKNVTTENIKDKLYDCLQSTFETIEVVKKDLSQIYEGVANDLDIMRANNSDYTKGVQEGLNSIGCEVEKAYNKGLNDAWELARKLELYENDGGLSTDKIERIFEHCIYDAFKCYTPQEALAKLEAYENEQNVIKVGDVVTACSAEGVVTNCDADFVTVISKDGISDRWAKIVCKKTGKHIDIQGVLEQVRRE